MTSGTSRWERPHPFFEPDEYTAINTRYFDELREAGHGVLDPSGWIETLSEAANIKLPPIRALPLGRYYMDEGEALADVRSNLHRLIMNWDGIESDPARFTACPSVGIASLLTMAVLRRQGVKRILFETPCYFAAILQAEWLGYEVVLIPTYRRDGYRRPCSYERSTRNLASVWWLTQPRVTLGFDQELGSLNTLLERLGHDDFLVVDEALDQSYPSLLGRLHKTSAGGQKLIRLKGFGKPLGLNGYRLAFVLHTAQLRAAMVDSLETFAGAIDAHSLAVACAVAAEPGHMEAMMRVANLQVVALCNHAESIVKGSNVAVNPLTNGYLGSAVVNIEALGPDQASRRHRLLLGCQKRRMPVIIGPSMHFASDPPTEAVRLNFFSRRGDILQGLSELSKIAGGVI